MPSLYNDIIKENTNYQLNLHYKFFSVKKKDNILKNNVKKVLYLTYLGVLKVLFSSRTGNAESFQHWCAKVLFTTQLGSDEDKYELVKSMFGGASIQAIKEAFKVSSGKTPCVYLFALGYANELLKTDKYSKDTLLYKFGNTDDLPRRSKEHERHYKKQFNIDHIELMLFSVIDPKYIVDAENSLKKFFQNNIISYENSTELIVLNKSDYDKTIQHYKLIKNSYIGCYLEMQDKIDKLERRLKDLQNEYDLTKEKLTNSNMLLQEKHNTEIEKLTNSNMLLQEKHNTEIEKLTNSNILLQQKHNTEIEKYKSQIKELDYKLMLKDKEIEILNIKLNNH